MFKYKYSCLSVWVKLKHECVCLSVFKCVCDCLCLFALYLYILDGRCYIKSQVLVKNFPMSSSRTFLRTIFHLGSSSTSTLWRSPTITLREFRGFMSFLFISSNPTCQRCFMARILWMWLLSCQVIVLKCQTFSLMCMVLSMPRFFSSSPWTSTLEERTGTRRLLSTSSILTPLLTPKEKGWRSKQVYQSKTTWV